MLCCGCSSNCFHPLRLQSLRRPGMCPPKYSWYVEDTRPQRRWIRNFWTPVMFSQRYKSLLPTMKRKFSTQKRRKGSVKATKKATTHSIRRSLSANLSTRPIQLLFSALLTSLASSNQPMEILHWPHLTDFQKQQTRSGYAAQILKCWVEKIFGICSDGV